MSVVFIDNGSSDGGDALVRDCDEVRAGRWMAIAEPAIGKFRAVKAASRFCIEVLGARHVAFLDADSEPEDAAWFTRSLELVARHPSTLGYVHSPVFYPDLRVVPRLFRAYLAYDAVVNRVTCCAGWLANGNGFVCSADVLREYFRHAEMTTEFDLRCSLLALAQGLAPIFNKVCIRSSARRSLASQANLDAWCFYQREFYTTKDINAAVKQSLDRRGEIADLPAEKVDAFFARRACKIASRHFVPFLLFHGRPEVLARVESALGVRVATRDLGSLTSFCRKETLFGDEFENMVRAIESHPVGVCLARRLAECMRQSYDTGASIDDGGQPLESMDCRGDQRAVRRLASEGPMRVPES